MPVWASLGIPALAATPGDTPVLLFNNETRTAGDKSQAAALVNAQGVIGMVVGFGVDIIFSADPGAFEVLVEISNDYPAVPVAYNSPWVTLDTITTVNGTYFFWHSDYSGVYAKFVRFNIVSLTNSVKITGRITR